MNRYLTVLTTGLVIALFFSIKSCRHLIQEQSRLSANQQALLSDIELYKTKDSLSVASVEKLTLTNREFSRYCSYLEKTVKNLNLKIRRLQSVSQTITETEYQVKAEIKDSIIIIPGQIDTVRCIDYRNNYLTLSGCIENRQFSGLIESRDTIIQIVHRVPRRFWFIRWGTKAIRQEVLSKNPYSRIAYTEYIVLKR